jgi:hypothetical protein
MDSFGWSSNGRPIPRRRRSSASIFVEQHHGAVSSKPLPPPPSPVLPPPQHLIASIAEAGEDHTDDLPEELLAAVFGLLGSGDRKRCSLVCRRWLASASRSMLELHYSPRAHCRGSLTASQPSPSSRSSATTTSRASGTRPSHSSPTASAQASAASSYARFTPSPGAEGGGSEQEGNASPRGSNSPASTLRAREVERLHLAAISSQGVVGRSRTSGSPPLSSSSTPKQMGESSISVL